MPTISSVPTFSYGALHNGQSAIIAPTGPGWTWNAGGNVVAQEADLVRFVPQRTITVTSLGFYVSTTAGSNDNVDVGIYQSTDGATYTRLVSSGATAGKLNAGNLQTVTIAATVLSGGTPYYAAVLCGAIGSTAAKLAAASYPYTSGMKVLGTTPGVIDSDFKSSAGTTLPASISSPGGGNSAAPIVFVNFT